ncbi:MAG: caspase family protein [Bacteroidales bacterium]|nr:caspase family protein [Bacteroidales bacterium]
MKKYLMILLAILSFLLGQAQSEGVSPIKSFNIAKEIKPPILDIVAGSVQFVDPSGNNAIDAEEQCQIMMKVRNSGMGDGIGLKAQIEISGSTDGITVKNQEIGTIKVGETKDISFPVNASMHTVDGRVSINVSVDEPNGLGTDKVLLNIDTKKFVAPWLSVVDYSVTEQSGSYNTGVLEKKRPFNLQILLQNTQYGDADNVSIKIVLPEGVLLIDGDEYQQFEKIKSTETKSLVYSLIITNTFMEDEIPITFKVLEKYNRYAENRTIILSLNQALTQKQIDVQPVETDQTSAIVIASLRSDVDVDIPISQQKHPNRFALIIGNEDYSSYQRGLQAESNVEFATNDASVFKDYCIKALGIPSDNVVLLTNATAARMSQEIEKISKLVQLKGADGELIFYYAGHGFPDEISKEPYLIPVDVTAANLQSGIKLYDLYERFSQIGAARITIFMDACFSGGGREAGLLAARAIRVTPKKGVLKGNVVVFSATQNDQFALPFTEKQHGMFTYYLLKQLKTNAQCTYGTLNDYLKSNVSEQSLRKNNKDQNPDTQYSETISNSWRNWTF